MLDFDLAALYEVETKVFNQAVKRNIKRFPKDFMFQLTKEEWESLRFQIETLEKQDNPLRTQIATLKSGRGQHTKYLPFAFTEQSVAMLSGILNTRYQALRGRNINSNINSEAVTLLAKKA
ncbi:MAG: ORF6N domain-containing protein [Bacteroidetes bacterium]|nr:ORF6N domain-containing protein [Bacteroidota bacterium]